MDVVNFLKLLGAFALADTSLQTAFTAENKATSISILAGHALVCGFIPFVVMGYNPYIFIWFSGTHYVIDYFTSRMGRKLKWSNYMNDRKIKQRWLLFTDIILHLLTVVMGCFLYG